MMQVWPLHDMEPELCKRREHELRDAGNDLAREVRVPPRARSRTGLQLTLPSLAEVPVESTTDVTSRHDPR